MKLLIFLLGVLFLGTEGCKQSPLEQYHALIKKERESSKTVNDIFFAISLGMPSKDFYTHCWQMNKQGIFADGPGSMSVLHKLTNNELKYPANMNFYPNFTNEKISSMWVKFEYAGWMPWNKKLSSDSLLPDVLKLYQKWYPDGNPFLKVTSKKRGDAYVKVDGNRRILVRRYDDMDVKVDYTDIRVEKID
jgi:hypothetical protein